MSQGNPDHPIRVAIDATPLLGEMTGVGEFCAGILQGLGSSGEAHVLAFAVSWRRRGEIVGHLPDGVFPVTKPMPARPIHFMWNHVSKPVIEYWTKKIDIVHGTNYVVPPTRKAGRVVSVHDLTTVRFPQLCDQATLKYPRLIEKAVRQGAWVHTDTQFIAQEVVDIIGVDPSRVRTVSPGIPRSTLGRELPEPNPLADELGKRKISKYVVFVGTIEPRKDLPTLLRAFGKLNASNTHLGLVIVGRRGWGSDEFDNTLRGLDSSTQDKIVLTGFVTRQDREAIIRNASCFVYPSLYEGFGFPPLEAMSLGVPVIATRAGGVPEVVGEAALLSEPKNEDDLALSIERVLGEANLAESLVSKGNVQAAKYTWQRCADGLISLYRSCLESIA